MQHRRDVTAPPPRALCYVQVSELQGSLSSLEASLSESRGEAEGLRGELAAVRGSLASTQVGAWCPALMADDG